MSSNSRRIRRPNKYSSDLVSQKSKSSKDHDSSQSTAAFSLDTLKVKRMQQQQQQQHHSQHTQSGQPRRSWSARCSHKLFFCLFVAATTVLVVRQMPPFLASHSATATATPGGTTTTATTATDAVTKKNSNKIRNNNNNKMVPKPGEYAPINAADASTPVISLLQAPTSDYHVFVLGTEGDQTTIRLVNLLIGLLEHSDVFLAITKWSVVGSEYLTRHKNQWVDNNATVTSLVVGETDVTQLAREFRSQYQQIFFFVVQTEATKEVCQAAIPHFMLCVDASMVANIQFGGKDNGITTTVASMIETIQKQLPFFAKANFNVVEALRRMNAMEEMMMQMADMPATSSETKYGVTGGSKEQKRL